MSQEEMVLKLDLIDDMTDIEDDMIEFLTSQKSIDFIEKTREIAFKEGGIKINKLIKNKQKIDEFEKSIKDHFKWIEKHIDDEYQDLNNYRNSQINIFIAYCLFYDKAFSNIKTYIDEEETYHELIKYFKKLKSIYC